MQSICLFLLQSTTLYSFTRCNINKQQIMFGNNAMIMTQVSKTKSELSPSPKLFNSSIYLVYFKVLVVNSCNCESGTNETN